MIKRNLKISGLILAGCIASTCVLGTSVEAAQIHKFELTEKSVIYKVPKSYELDEKDVIYNDDDVEPYELDEDDIIYNDAAKTKKNKKKNRKEKEVKEEKEEKKSNKKKGRKVIEEAAEEVDEIDEVDEVDEVDEEEVDEEEAATPRKVEAKEKNTEMKEDTEINKKRVYLSQSTQWDNLYYSKDISEGEQMGKLLKIVKENLLEKNIEVFTNDTSMDFKASLKYGNSLENIDAYVALHSNAQNTKARGPLAIRSDKQKDVGLAESIYEELIEIYPEKKLGRGVMVNNKYAETNGTIAPSTIIEDTAVP